MISHLDAHIGHVLDVLEVLDQSPFATSTLILFADDNSHKEKGM